MSTTTPRGPATGPAASELLSGESASAREVLRRKTPLPPGGWLFFLTTCVGLAISAAYEFVEWGTALLSGEAAMAFLGTQGDVWDTQWDMFLALLGALTAQLLLTRLHERQLARLPQSARPL